MTEDLKVSSPADLKGASTRIVKTKSGNVYKIRRMRLPTMSYLFSNMDLAQDLTEQLKKPDSARRLFEAMDAIVPECIAEPLVTRMPTENSIIPSDIPPLDVLDLFPEILDLSGYSKSKIAAATNFREKLSGESSEGTGEANEPATE